MKPVVLLPSALAAYASEPAPSNGVPADGPQTEVAVAANAAIRPEVRTLAERTVPGMTVTGAERKERGGRACWDVESKSAMDVRLIGSRADVPIARHPH